MRSSLVATCLIIGIPLSHAAASSPQVSRWNVTSLGAVADGTTDCTGAFQKALDTAGEAGGGVVEVPAGRYHFDGTLSVPRGVTLEGTYRVPPTVSRKDGPVDGSILLAHAGRGSDEGPPFLHLSGDNSAIHGLVVIYPQWQQSDVPPIPYPPCVFSENTMNVGIEDCCLLNPYQAIKLVRAHRHLVRNVTGYPSWRGLFVDQCYDIGHIENIHFWPFGVAYDPENPYCKWVNTQAVAFELARTDWHYVANTFCFGYGVGYKFSQSDAGSTNGNFLGLGADSCRRAVLVEQAQAPGLLITNGEFVGRWSSKDSVCVEVGEQVQGKVSLVNCSFWGPIDRCVWMRSPFGQFTASACHFVHWDNQGVGSPAIQLDAGRAIVQACTFAHSGTHVEVAERVRSALITTNQAMGGLRCENRAEARVQLLANETDPLTTTPGALSHYHLDIGAPGDDAYLRRWHGRERRGTDAAARAVRWSRDVSLLILPVMRQTPYRLQMELEVPSQAASPEAGLYLGKQKLADISPETKSIDVQLPPQDDTEVLLELRCRGWVPRDLHINSQDDRTLGVSVYSLEMTAANGDPRVFCVNEGDWKKQP